MASFQAFLHVGGKKYAILYSDLLVGQAVDALGRPASLTQGGIFTVQINTPGQEDATLYEWMVSPTKIMDGKVVIKRIDTNATLKVIKFYNAYCVDMLVEFDGTANASFFRTTIRISPEQIDIGGIFHDNNWPEQSPIRAVADDDELALHSSLIAPAAYTTGEEKPPKRKPKKGFQQPTVTLPPARAPLPEWKLPPRPTPPPGGWPSTLMKRLAEWVAASGRAVLGGIGVFILAMLSPLDAGVANEWERKLPDEEENRYRELEAKRSELLARGQKLSPPEEAEWQALEDRKFPAGRSGGGKKRNGADRAAEYGANWPEASLQDAINKFAPGAKGIPNAKGDKIIYKGSDGKQIVYDLAGNYFRIEDTTLPGKRVYLDMDGKVPNNKTENGKQTGRTKEEYEAATHHKNID